MQLLGKRRLLAEGSHHLLDDRPVLRERTPGRGVPLAGEGQRTGAPGVIGTEHDDQVRRGDGLAGR